MKHIVGFSGGIDSQACALWVRQRFPVEDIIVLFADTGWEDALTYEFVRNYSESVFPVTFVTPRVDDLKEESRGLMNREAAGLARTDLKPEDVLTMERLALTKRRFASSRARFCTTYLKLFPQIRWMRENIPFGEDFKRYIGVRRDESRARRDVPETEWDELFDCELNRPLATWTKTKCFEFVKSAGEKTNPLYEMGQSRVGCSPCHERTKEDIREWAAYRPSEVEKVRQAERRVGRTFFPPVVPGKTMNFIDEVIAWANTERGGKRTRLPFLEEDALAGTCSSKYGLCE